MDTTRNEQVEALTPADKLDPEVRANMLANQTGLFFNVALYEHAQRIAQMFANSTMVPEHFRNNVGNCMIGLNYAHRLGADAFMTLQNLYVVKGRPGVEAKLVIAQINASNKYSAPIKYKWLDEKGEEITPEEVIKDRTREGYGCRAYSVEAKTGETVFGPKITWGIVNKEGWYNKEGSKWKSIPEIMFNYRAASWFANVNCPEMKLGMPTADELEDTALDLTPVSNGSFAMKKADLPAGTVLEISKDRDSKAYWQIHATLNEQDQEALVAFTKETAEAQEIGIGDVECAVTDEFKDTFLEQFRAWQKGRKPSDDGPTDQEKPPVSLDGVMTAQEIVDWETIKNLKTRRFTGYMDADHNRIPTMSGQMKKNLGNKCRAIFNMTLGEKLAEYAEPERDPATGATNGTGALIDCPNDLGSQIYTSECEHCQDRQGCPSHPEE